MLCFASLEQRNTLYVPAGKWGTYRYEGSKWGLENGEKTK